MATADVVNADTHFFGLRACSEKLIVDGEEVSGKLVSVQFYLRDDKAPEGELIEMETVGPLMDLETMICPRRKLEDTEMYVDKVTVYESDLGLEAMKFHVGEKFELFGTPVEGATETVIEFTTDSRLVGFSGIASFTGIKGVQLS